MNFLVDAQLPRRLAQFLADAGHDTIHALLQLFETHLDAAIHALEHADFVELRAAFLVVHARPDKGVGLDL